MKSKNFKSIVLVTGAAVALIMVFIFVSGGTDWGRRTRAGKTCSRFLNIFSSQEKDRDKVGPETGSSKNPEDMDKLYIFTDENGSTRVSSVPPEGKEFQVLYIPRENGGSREQRVRRAMADRMRKLFHGGKIPNRGPEGESIEKNEAVPPGLPQTEAGENLDKSNALRLQMEKNERRKRSGNSTEE
jgi:hypothetical protein